jgi:hypothetical protein
LAFAWPQAELDPVARMRALAAARPHVAANETLFDVPFDRLWSFVSDFENNTPRFEATVGRARILERSGDRLRLETRGPLPGPWMRFDVVLRPGWCLMRSKLGEIGMAARAEGEASTRFFHFEGSAMLGRVVRPLFAWNIKQDFKKLRALL